MVSAVSYYEASVPIQGFSINHHPKPSAHELIFRIPDTIRFVCVCVSDTSHTHHTYMSIFTPHRVTHLASSQTLIIFKIFYNRSLVFWGFLAQRFVERYHALSSTYFQVQMLPNYFIVCSPEKKIYNCISIL